MRQAIDADSSTVETYWLRDYYSLEKWSFGTFSGPSVCKRVPIFCSKSDLIVGKRELPFCNPAILQNPIKMLGLSA